MKQRAKMLAERLEQGAAALLKLAESLTDAQWQTKIPHDGRSVGVVVHHVADMYPLEVDLALGLAAGKPITGVTWDAVHGINAKHAKEHAGVGKQEALELLRRNSAAASAAIRALSDPQLDAAAPVSLYEDAPLTAQFFIEDHALRHSFHHLLKARQALGL
jgi:DinB superfamily